MTHQKYTKRSLQTVRKSEIKETSIKGKSLPVSKIRLNIIT